MKLNLHLVTHLTMLPGCHTRSYSLLNTCRRVGRYSGKRKESSSSVTKSSEVPEDRDDRVPAQFAHPPLQSKAPKREPFVKNLFTAKFDKTVLEFPEVLLKDRDELLHDMLVPISKFFKEEVDDLKIDKMGETSKETIQGLKDLGLFGMHIPMKQGGLGLCSTEVARILEVVSKDLGIGLTLVAHNFMAAQAILKHGSDDQKEKYLPLLASGEMVAAFAHQEVSGGTDSSLLTTKAVVTSDGRNFVINGGKIWVVNGPIADLFIVTANTLHKDGNELPIMYIIERNFGGVSIGEQYKTLGTTGSSISELKFENTTVPAANRLDKEGRGYFVISTAVDEGRFSIAPLCLGSMKNILNLTLDHLVNRKQYGQQMSAFHRIKQKISEISVDIYAIESMVYLTAGLADMYENQDVAVEKCILNIFATERSLLHSQNCLELLGADAQKAGNVFEKNLRDMTSLLSFCGSNDTSRMYVALAGLQHSGQNLYRVIEMLRNPFMFPKENFKHRWTWRNFEQGKYPLDIHLKESLHPSLERPADALELCIRKLEHAVTRLLERHGMEVVEPHCQGELCRLADAVILIYAMVAVLARSSRAHCIGLRNAHQEINIATEFCFLSRSRVDEVLDQVLLGVHVDRDQVMRYIADGAFDRKQYAPVHCLTRVFW